MPTKPLVPVLGEPMISRVARALVEHPRIGRLIILAQEEKLITSYLGAEWLGEHPAIAFEVAGDSVSQALAAALARHPGDYPFFVTTADHALLDGAMIDAFLDRAGAADVAVGMVERRTLLAAYPESRRTWLKFRGGAYSGANLFLFGSPRALKVLDLWRTVESQRKRAQAVIGAFGPLMLAATALRILSLRQALRWAGRRLGLEAVPVEMPMAEACIDVDKPEDQALVTRILEKR